MPFDALKMKDSTHFLGGGPVPPSDSLSVEALEVDSAKGRVTPAMVFLGLDSSRTARFWGGIRGRYRAKKVNVLKSALTEQTLLFWVTGKVGSPSALWELAAPYGLCLNLGLEVSAYVKIDIN